MAKANTEIQTNTPTAAIQIRPPYHVKRTIREIVPESTPKHAAANTIHIECIIGAPHSGPAEIIVAIAIRNPNTIMAADPSANGNGDRVCGFMIILVPNVEMSCDPLWAACGSGMSVI